MPEEGVTEMLFLWMMGGYHRPGLHSAGLCLCLCVRIAVVKWCRMIFPDVSLSNI